MPHGNAKVFSYQAHILGYDTGVLLTLRVGTKPCPELPSLLLVYRSHVFLTC